MANAPRLAMTEMFDLPSPLAGEGGPRTGVGEGCERLQPYPSSGRLRRPPFAIKNAFRIFTLRAIAQPARGEGR